MDGYLIYLKTVRQIVKIKPKSITDPATFHDVPCNSYQLLPCGKHSLPSIDDGLVCSSPAH